MRNEGKIRGKGNLLFILKKDGHEVAKGSMELELRPAKQFFQVFKIGAVGSNSAPEGIYKDDFVKKDDYLLFVHGFNVNETEKKQWPATVFKRLWWQGYTGHLGFFDWPCTVTDWGNPNPGIYDDSDFNAWRCGEALKNRLVDLNSGKRRGKVRVIAHSQGNIITGEAIRQSPNNILHTYIATQAAISGDCYQKGLAPYFNDYTTPNVLAKYPGTSSPYLTGIDRKVGKRFSYYNAEDWALVKGPVPWELNNSLRPDFGYWYEDGDGTLDTYLPPMDFFYREDGQNTPLLFPKDTFEIFSYAAEARGKAIGAAGNVGSFSSFDLQRLGYDREHYSHSRQFRSNIVDEWNYWSRVISNAQLPKK